MVSLTAYGIFKQLYFTDSFISAPELPDELLGGQTNDILSAPAQTISPDPNNGNSSAILTPQGSQGSNVQGNLMSPPQQQSLTSSNIILNNQNDNKQNVASPSLSSPLLMVRPAPSSTTVSISLPAPSSTPNSAVQSQQQISIGVANHNQKMTPTTQYNVDTNPQLTLIRPNSQLQSSINSGQQSGSFPPNVMITSQNTNNQVSVQQRMNSLPQFSNSQQQHHLINNRMSSGTISQNIVPNNNYSSGVSRPTMQVRKFNGV